MPEINKAIQSTQRDADLFIEDAVSFLRDIQKKGMCCKVHEYFFRLTLDEALQNSLHHGNSGNAGKKIFIAIQPSERFLTITVRDEGKGFSPREVTDPRLPDNITRPGGRGIHLIKNFGHTTWNDAGNEITIIMGEENTPNAN